MAPAASKSMFIISISYKKPLSEVDAFLVEHVEYLDRQYRKGVFIASGRKNPRTGGIILSKLKRKEDVEKAVQEDPFFKKEIADHEIIEFYPTKVAEGFESLKEEPDSQSLDTIPASAPR